MGRTQLAAAPLLAVAVVACAAASQAAEVEVYPLRLDLTDRQPRDVITVVNNDDARVTFQVEKFLWSQEDGGDHLTPTDDLLAVPPVFTVAPAATQAVRIGFRQVPDVDSEASYRLIFTEVPDTTDLEAGLAVAMVLRLSLPVFFAPPRATANPQWSARRVGPQVLELALGNVGNAHIQVSELAVFSAAQPDRRLAATDAGRYVLPGATATWTLRLDLPLSESNVIVQATTRRGIPRETVAVSPR